MQSIARDSDESSDDEFFDAHGKREAACSPWPSWERPRGVCDGGDRARRVTWPHLGVCSPESGPRLTCMEVGVCLWA